MFLCVPINVKKLDTDIYVHVKEDGKKNPQRENPLSVAWERGYVFNMLIQK